MGNFKDAFINLFKKKNGFVLSIINGWGVVDFRILLAPKYIGYLIKGQSYEFFSIPGTT